MCSSAATSQIRAVLNSGPAGEAIVESVVLLPPGPHDVVVRVGASGVCHSDLAAAQGLLGKIGMLVLGHEGAGVVVDVGAEVSDLSVGDRVVASFRPACGRCWYCVRDLSQHCATKIPLTGNGNRVARADGSVVGTFVGLGTFSEQMTVDANSVVKVRTDLPDDQLALIGCGVTTGVGAVLNTARVPAGASVAVIGCGGVGQAAIQAARIAGASQIVAVDPVDLKRQTALRFGATETLDPTAVDPIEAIREMTDGRGVDYAFEVVGLPQTMQQSHAMLRLGGTTVLVGVPREGATVSFDGRQLQTGERHIIGCSYGSARIKRDFEMMIRFVESGQLDLASMISRRITLDGIEAAFGAMENGEVIRSVVVPAS